MRLISKPVLCNYYVTYRCNAACDFCDIWEKPSPYVSETDVRKNLIDLKKMGVKVIDFTGGEPLLHREIGQFLRIAKELGFITTLTTNCLLYPKRSKEIRGLVDMLHFSLDSVEEEKHNESRKVNCFNHVQESIRIAKELGEKPDILFTVSNDNCHEIPKAHKEYAIKHKLILILNPIFGYNDINERSGLNERSLNMLESWGRKQRVFLNQAFIALRRNGGNSTEKPICKAASSTVVISPKNELLLPCYHLEEERFPINNDLLSLRNTPKVKALIRKEGTYTGCEGCTINCYMQPSFSVFVNQYWWKSFSSSLKYNYYKGTWKQLFRSSSKV